MNLNLVLNKIKNDLFVVNCGFYPCEFVRALEVKDHKYLFTFFQNTNSKLKELHTNFTVLKSSLKFCHQSTKTEISLIFNRLIKNLKDSVKIAEMSFPITLIEKVNEKEDKLKSSNLFLCANNHERNLILSLANPKKLAHIFGDAFVHRKKTLTGEPLEGLSYFDAALLFLQALHHYPSPNIQAMVQLVEESFPVFQIIDSVLDSENFVDRISHYQSAHQYIKTAVEKLPQGKSLLLPLGWHHPDGNHACLGKVTKTFDGVRLEIFNTGQGMEYQGVHRRNGRTFGITRKLYWIPNDKLEKFLNYRLRALLEYIIFGECDPKSMPEQYRSTTTVRYTPEEFYRILSEFEISEQETQASLLMEAGLCSFKGFITLSKHEIGVDAEEIKQSIQLTCLQLIFKYHEIFLCDDLDFLFIVERALSNFSSHQKKLMGRGSKVSLVEPDVIAGWENLLKRYLRPFEMQSALAALPEDANCQTKDIVRSIERAQRTGSRNKSTLSLDSAYLNPLLSPFNIFNTPDDYQKRMQVLIHALEKYEKIAKMATDEAKKSFDLYKFVHSHYITFAIRDLYQIFIDPNLIETKKIFCDFLKNHPSKHQQLISCLSVLIERYATMTNAYTNSRERLVAIHGLFLMLWQIAQIGDEINSVPAELRIENFGFFMVVWDALTENKLTMLMNNSQLFEKDHDLIDEIYLSRNKNKTKKFFAFIDNVSRYPFFDHPEYDYALGYYHQLSEAEKLKINSQYFESKYSKDHFAKETNWQAAWAFSIKGVPNYFSKLVNAAVALFYAAPWHKATGFPIIKKFAHSDDRINIEMHFNFSREFVSRNRRFFDSKKCDDISFSPEHKKLCFNEYDENTAINYIDRYLQPVQTVQSTSHELRIGMLIDFYKNNFCLLLQPSHRIWISATIAAPCVITRLVSQSPLLTEQLQRFIEEAIAYLEENHREDDRENKNIAVAFLLCHYSFLLTSIHGNVLAVKETIYQKLLQNETTSSENKYLIIAYLELFRHVQDFDQESMAEFLKWQQVFNGLRNTQDSMPKILKQRPVLLQAEKFESIKRFFATKQALHTIKWLLNTRGIQCEHVKWDIEKFPRLKIEADTNTYLFDLVTYTWDKKYDPCDENSSIYCQDYYVKLFKDKRLPIETIDDKLVISYQGSLYEFMGNCPVVIAKVTNGQRKFLWPLDELGIFSNNLLLWVSEEKIEIVPEPNAIPLSHITKNGIFSFHGISGSFELFKPKNKADFFLNSKTIYFKATQREQSIEEVHIISLGGTESYLILILENGYWRSPQYPNCEIQANAILKGASYIKDKFIFLKEHANNKKFVLTNVLEKESLVELNLFNNQITIQKDPYHNIYAALILFRSANFQSDYVKVIQLLEQTKIRRCFEEKEKELLKRFRNESFSLHFTPEKAVVELYSMWLLDDNNRRFPKPNDSSLFNFRLLLTQYFVKRNNLPWNLRIENIIPKRYLDELGFSEVMNESSFNQSQPKIKTLSMMSIPWYNDHSRFDSHFPLITRLGNNWDSYLFFLTQEATSEDPKRREVVFELLICTLEELSDGYRCENNKYILTVWAAYYSAEKEHQLQPSASRYFLAWKNKNSEAKTYGDDFFREFNKYNKKSKIDYSFASTTLSSILAQKDRKSEQISFNLGLTFHPNHGLFEPIQQLGHQSFQKIDCTEIDSSSLFVSIKNQSEMINRRLLALNAEVSRGRYLNNLEQSLVFLKAPQEIYNWILGSCRETLKRYLRKDQLFLLSLEESIVTLANSKLKSDPALRYDVQGKKLSLLQLQDVMQLLEISNVDKIFEKTGLEPIKQQKLYQDLGEYLETLTRVIHISVIFKAMHDLEVAPSGCQDAIIKKIGYLLLQPHAIVDQEKPLIQLIFQARAHMIATEDQATCLSEMLFKNIFTQRIQGSGKTIYWGPYLTRNHANGSELMIFVPSLGQYIPTINNMGANQLKLFMQKHHVIEFSDAYGQFTKSYLNYLLITLQTALEDGHFVIANNEITLRTMRGKYIKMAIEIYNNPLFNKNEKEEFKQTNTILKDILAFIRKRGHLVLDEVHEATHPKNTTNLALSNSTFLKFAEGEIIAFLLLKAASIHDENGIPILDFVGNHQSQISPSQKILINEKLAQFCVSDTRWCSLTKMTNLSISQKQELASYLCTRTCEKPLFVTELIRNTTPQKNVKTAPELLFMTRKLLAKSWLMNALSDPTYERYQVVQRQEGLPTAVPCTFNMQPSKISEFSNPYHMAIQTMTGALVQGLLENQISSFISYYKYLAITEARNDDIALEATKIACDFKRLLEVDLKKLGVGENNVTLRNKLRSSNPEIMKLVLDYILNRVIVKKPLFQEQVASNGVSTITMGNRVVGYSGTIDTPHLDIVLNYQGDKVEVKQEFGTDGRTLDLIYRRHDTVYIMNNDAAAIFRDVLTRLSEDQQSRFKVIIDAGCHFRGVLPHLVAEMMIEYQKILNLKYQYVIFFNLEHELCYISKDNPQKVGFLKSLHLKGIAKELQTTVDQIACYLAQDKATGTNFKFLPGTLSLLTATENTQAYLTIQGLRRMREADTSHEIIHCVQKGSLDKMAELVDKPSLLKLCIGKVVQKDFIIDLLAFVYINRFMQLPHEEYLLCVQNLYNIAQQYLLDKIFNDELSEEIVFTKAADLFVENVAIDFIKEEGLAKKWYTQREHLEKLIQSILGWVEAVNAPPNEITIMRKTMINTMNGFLPDLPAIIELTVPEKVEMSSIDGTMIQMQQRQREQKQHEKKEQYFIVSKDNKWEKPADPISLTKEVLLSPEFPKIGQNEPFPIMTLDSILEGKFPNKWDPGILDPEVLVTKNYVQTKVAETNIGDLNEKTLKHFLLIRKNGKLQLLVLSISDAVAVASIFSENPILPNGCDMWLIRPSGDLAWTGPSSYNKKDFVSDPNVARLCVQPLLINGQYKYLDTNYWYKALDEWLTNHPKKHLLILYFKEVGLRDTNQEDYEQTNLSKLLDTY